MKHPIHVLLSLVLLAAGGCARSSETAPAEFSAAGAAIGGQATGQLAPAPLSTGALRFAKPVASWKDIRERNVVMQQYDYSCGAAALATLMRYYFGDPVTEREILKSIIDGLSEEELKKREKEGFSLLDLKQFAERRGYQAVGIRLELSALPKLRGPVLVYLELPDSKHFAILRGVRQDRVYLADPSRGNLRMPVFRFANQWPSGIALVLGKPGFGTPPDTPLSVDQTGPFRIEVEDAREALYTPPLGSAFR